MSKRRRIIIFAIIIVVVAGVSAAVALILSQQHSSTNSGNSSNTNGGNSSGTAIQAADQKANDADKAAATGDVNGGVQQLDDAIKNTNNSSDQFVYYSHKATLLFNSGDLPGALEAAQAAYNIQKTSDSAAFVGQIANQKGDKAMALDYYKKAIGLIDPNDPFSNEDKSYYQGIVNDLQGGK